MIRFQTHLRAAWALLLSAGCFTAQAAGPFEGSFSWREVVKGSGGSEFTNYVSYSLLQKGSYVCGSWFSSTGPFAVERKGIVAGRATGSSLIASVCGDPEDDPDRVVTCPVPDLQDSGTPASSHPVQFLAGQDAIVLLGGAGGREPQMVLRRTRESSRGPDHPSGFSPPLPHFLADCERPPDDQPQSPGEPDRTSRVER